MCLICVTFKLLLLLLYLLSILFCFLPYFQIKSLTGTTVPEYKMQQIKRSRLILLHYGIFKIGWDWLILLCTFYVAIMVPYNAAFVTMEGSNERASIVSDVIVEMLFIIGKRIHCYNIGLCTGRGDVITFVTYGGCITTPCCGYKKHCLNVRFYTTS